MCFPLEELKTESNCKIWIVINCVRGHFFTKMINFCSTVVLLTKAFKSGSW